MGNGANGSYPSLSISLPLSDSDVLFYLSKLQLHLPISHCGASTQNLPVYSAQVRLYQECYVRKFECTVYNLDIVQCVRMSTCCPSLSQLKAKPSQAHYLSWYTTHMLKSTQKITAIPLFKEIVGFVVCL